MVLILQELFEQVQIKNVAADKIEQLETKKPP